MKLLFYNLRHLRKGIVQLFGKLPFFLKTSSNVKHVASNMFADSGQEPANIDSLGLRTINSTTVFFQEVRAVVTY